MGGVSHEGGHHASDPLYVPKFSCEYDRRVTLVSLAFQKIFPPRSFEFFFFVLLRLESDTSTNVNGDLAATPQRRAGEAEQQFEDDHAAHWHSDHVPGRRRSEHSQLEEEQRHDHRWHPQRLLGSATIGGRL